MSFRDAFTRNDSGSENLQYDDVAAYHFYITILVLLFVPLTYSIIKSILNPFSHIPHLKQVESRPQFRERICRFKKQYKYNYMTKWFVVKVVIIMFICFGMYRCFIVLQETGDQMKGFDPYQILEVEPDAPIEKIKKSYRKLALKYHPDRNKDDPQASARFIMISKAYECLTNEQAKQNCLKYGNPEGSTSFNVGIALPSFLVKKQNQVVIMGILFLLMVIVCPIVVIYYQSQINKYDQNGMLLQNHPNLHTFIHQHFSIRDCVKALPICLEFRGSLPSSNQQAYDQLMKKASDDVRNFIIKKKFLGYINKAMLLMDARINQQPIPQHLIADQKKVLKIVPVLVRGMVMLALTRSSEQFKIIYRGQNFAGVNTIESIIKFGQYFIQGKTLDSESFEQLDLQSDEIDKIYKKKKNKKITNLNALIHNTEDRDYFLNLLSPERVPYITNCLQYLPKIEMEVVVHTVGDKQITRFDLVEVMIELKSQRIGSFCSSVSYPFLKQEGWYIIAADNNTVLFMENFNFDKPTQEFKFKRRPHDKIGEYSVEIKLFSDCYFGLDIERTIKYKVIEGQKTEEQTTDHEQDTDNDTLFSKMMSNLIPKQEEQLSDKED